MSNITDQIKEKLDIVEFLKGYMQVNPAGKNFKALCPFHKENTPSFMISPDRQSWYCFGGCNEGGDVFKFLMKYENIEFYEALKTLAEKAGIDFRKSASSNQEYKQYGILYEINEEAKNFFVKEIASPLVRNDIWRYLQERGLRKETIDEFELGFAPQGGRDNLLLELINLGFDAKDIERAGLAIKTIQGTYRDRFYNRIIFPISNHFGKVVGFTGRIFKEDKTFDAPKYLNSPETLIFNKSRLLYGFHKSKTAIREKSEAVLVEGQMDFLMAYQDGVNNVTATSGTALTVDHLKTLRRIADKIVISFDSDEAGQLAAERSIDLAAANDFFVKVLLLSEKDPAEIVKAEPGKLSQIVIQAKPAMEFMFNRYLKDGQNLAYKKSGTRVILSKIKNVFSNIEQSAWLKELSAITSISENSLIEEMEKLPKQAASKPISQLANQPVNQMSVTKKQLIAQRIVDLGGEVPMALIANLPNEAVLKASLENSSIPVDKKKTELESLQKELKKEIFKEKRSAIRQKVILAEKSGNNDLLKDALQEFDNINKEFYNL